MNSTEDNLNPQPQTHSELAELRMRLSAELNWQPDKPPHANSTLQSVSLSERSGRGFYGEDLMLRTLSERGEIILDAGRGPEDVNKGGPDAVTLAENEDGKLVLKFYDNKAYSTQINVSSVSSLDRTFENSLRHFKQEWGRLATPDSECTPAQRDLFGKALELIDGRHYECWVTNYNGKVTRVSNRLSDSGIGFEDMQGHLDLPSPRLQTVFSESPTPEQAIASGPPPQCASVFDETQNVPDVSPSHPISGTSAPSHGPRLH
jgi:hypothetical protein